MIIACAAGQGEHFERELAGLGPEIVAAEEPERLGRGGGIKFAARQRREDGDVYALNGDELVDVDFAALLARHREAGGAATVAVARPKSPFGVVELGDDDVVTGFSEGGRIPYWVNCGIYVLSAEAVERFPDRGDHETTTFPELAAEGRLLRLPARGALADGEHAEGAARRGRARRGASGVACAERIGADGLAELESLDAWAFEPRRVEKPWGYELIWALTDVYCGKVLFVKAGSRSRSSSTARRTSRGSSSRAARSSSSARVGRVRPEDGGRRRRAPRSTSAPGTVHRVTAIEDTTILEVSTPHLDDVVRLEDAYGRAGTSAP